MTQYFRGLALLADADGGPRSLWSDEIDGTLDCIAVRPTTPEVTTFVLAPREPRTFHHLPGQYLTVTVDIDGRSFSRCYTISSPPTRPYSVAISVKREPGGVVSNWLHDRLVVGGSLQASGPRGAFTCAAHPSPKYLFLAGGVGITPLMSMVRTMHDLADPADVVLVHNVRCPEHVVFRSELDHLEATSDRLRVAVICESAGTGTWSGRVGRLSTAVLAEIVADLHEREVFLCGPAAYMSAANAMLIDAGVDVSRIHSESFVLEVLEAPPLEPADNGGDGEGSFQVEFTRSFRSVRCKQGVTILQAAMDAGLKVPSSCGQGMCGTCKSTLLRGAVGMRHSGGIRPREIAQNKILLCCSTPLADLVVDA